MHLRAGQKQMNEFDRQVGGNHYQLMTIQPSEYIMANNLGWCEANVVKYISRWREKGGVEDLRKAQHYIGLLIQREIGGSLTSKEAPTIGGRVD